jgi:hypothetical protein
MVYFVETFSFVLCLLKIWVLFIAFVQQQSKVSQKKFCLYVALFQTNLKVHRCHRQDFGGPDVIKAVVIFPHPQNLRRNSFFPTTMEAALSNHI